MEYVLARYSPTIPINSTDGLLLAATDELIHLDGVYFVLRRHPNVLTIILLSRLTNNNNRNRNITDDQYSTVSDNDNDNNNHFYDHNDNDIVNHDYDADGNGNNESPKK